MALRTMKTTSRAGVVVLGLFSVQSLHGEEFGAWIVGTEIDNMTEKKTDYALGRGQNITMTIICEISTCKYKDFLEKRSLLVNFKTSDYLGYGPGRPPAVLFRVDQQPALNVTMRGYFPQNISGVYSGTSFVEKLLEQPSKQVRLRFTSFDYSNHYEYTIPLDGMAQAVNFLMKNCGMTPQNTWRSKDKDDSITVP